MRKREVAGRPVDGLQKSGPSVAAKKEAVPANVITGRVASAAQVRVLMASP